MARAGLALADRRVEVLGGRDLEPLHARRQRVLVVGLDEQVHMGALDADVYDAEVLAPNGRQRGLADREIGEATAQAAHAPMTRKTTCTGCRALSSGRALCGEPARRPLGLRPAPRRLPPRFLNSTSCAGSELRERLRRAAGLPTFTQPG
jgi:hypothetical protein